jgi:hypothetical protein
MRVDKDGMAVDGDGSRRKTRAVSMGDLVPLEIHVQEATIRVLKNSKVGFFKETMDYQTFYDRLVMEGQHEVTATFMGGNMVLLQCPCEGELEEVMKFNSGWWDQCFSKILPWKPNFVSESREIWIQIYGIPLHAWEEGSFKMVAGRFGVFVDFDEATVAKQRLDVARVKLRTVRRGMIDTVLQLKVQGSSFDVWVVEERCSCWEDRDEVDASDRSLEKTTSNSGEHGWKGDDRDLFSDGSTDSDASEPYDMLGGIPLEAIENNSVMACSNGEKRNIDLQGQNFFDRTGEVIVSGEPLVAGHVANEGDLCKQTSNSVLVGGRNEVRGVVGPGVEVSNMLKPASVLPADEEQACGSRRVEVDVMGVNNQSGPIGPTVGQWNPFEESEDLGVGFGDPAHLVELNDLRRVAQENHVGVFGVDEVEGGGANGVERSSQLSESSFTDSQEGNKLLRKRNRSSKGGSQNPGRHPPNLMGVPKFRQLELILKNAGRRRKEDPKGKSSEGDLLRLDQQSSNHSATCSPGVCPTPTVDATLPIPGSGVAHLLDIDGDPVPESVGAGVSMEAEAVVLLGIQKEVGFTFEVGDDEIQSKLIELANKHSDRNVEWEQRRGYQ